MSSPILESRLRGMRWLLLFSIGAVLFVLFLESKIPPVQPAKIAVEKEWLYVTTNNVLFFRVNEGKCQTETKYALLQVHEGLKVQVIARRGKWVEVEMEDQSKLFTHGCIHETVLEKRK